MSKQDHSKPVEPEAVQPEAPASLDPKAKRDAAEREIERLKREVSQTKEQYLRAAAEFDNTKKRLQREKDEHAKYAAETVIRDLLPILDALDQALVSVDKHPDTDPVVKGIHLIHRQLLGLLKANGVSRIATVGETFDPHLHEAITHEELDGKAENEIVEDVQAGYTMHGKVVRPAMVKIARLKGTATDGERVSG